MPMPIRLIRATLLDLDPENPRLPAEAQGAGQERILDYLAAEAVLDELVASVQEHGFFSHEPLVVVAHADRFVVVEGNRRLAAILSMQREGLLSDELEIPCLISPDRTSVDGLIGYKHIGGIKPWSSEAKARYIYSHIERLVANGSQEVFKMLGRQIGSNARGIRNSFIAYSILRSFREETGEAVAFVMRERFGVWLRCLNSPELRQFIGLEPATSYEEVVSTVKAVDADRLREIISDLTVQQGASRAVLGDSRDVTDYGRVLVNDAARGLLRRTGSLEAAARLAKGVGFHDEVQRIDSELRRTLERATDVGTHEAHASVGAARGIVDLARQILAILQTKLTDADD